MSSGSSSSRHAPTIPELLAAETALLPPLHPSDPLVTTLEDVQHSQMPIEETAYVKDGAPNPPPDPPPPLSRTRLILIAMVATLCIAMSSGGQMSLFIALPSIQRDLNISENSLQWIASAYGLTGGCFLLLAGRVADIWGRKKVFIVGMVWFGLWNLIGGFMKNGAALIVTRALTGMGASMTTPSGFGIIAAHFDGKARAYAFATFSAGAPVGAAVGLILGGLLTTYAPTTWRAILWVFAGLAAMITILAVLVFPSDRRTTDDKRLDWFGAFLITLGLVLLQFSVSDAEGASRGWRTGYIIALLIISIFLIVAFVFWENYLIKHTTRPPLMRLQLWTRANGRLAAVYMIGFVSFMGFVSTMYHSTLFFQQVQLLDPVQAFIRFLPCAVSGTLCNVLVAKIISRMPTQWIVCIGLCSTGIASVLYGTAPADVSYWAQPFNAMWSLVLGADFLMATGALFVSRLSLPGEQSVAGALFQTLIQLGGAFGLAITTVIATAYENKALSQGKQAIPALLEGLHAAFWLSAGISFLALAVAIVALRGMGTIGKGTVKGEPVSGEERSEKTDQAEAL